MWLTLMVASAFAMDHGPLQQALSAHVTARGRVDYAGLKASGALDGYLGQLASASEPGERAEKMAFWINAYNALTIDLIADNYPLDSIRDLDGGDPWGARSFAVAGRQVTLNAIEHEILRPMGDARIHAAVNCASRGCPPLSPRVFSGSGLDAELDDASRRWMTINGVVVDAAQGTVKLSRIFEWYGGDFVDAYGGVDIPGVEGEQEAALAFAARYLPEQSDYLLKGGYSVGFSSYSWRLNKQ